MEVGKSHVCVKEWMEASTGVDGGYRRDTSKFYLSWASIIRTWTLPFGSLHSNRMSGWGLLGDALKSNLEIHACCCSCAA